MAFLRCPLMRVVTSMISGSFLLGKELFININLIFSSMVSIEISVNWSFLIVIISLEIILLKYYLLKLIWMETNLLYLFNCIFIIVRYDRRWFSYITSISFYDDYIQIVIIHRIIRISFKKSDNLLLLYKFIIRMFKEK